jgi:hypothetical protein
MLRSKDSQPARGDTRAFTLLEVALIVAIIGMMLLMIIGYVFAPHKPAVLPPVEATTPIPSSTIYTTPSPKKAAATPAPTATPAAVVATPAPAAPPAPAPAATPAPAQIIELSPQSVPAFR